MKHDFLLLLLLVLLLFKCSLNLCGNFPDLQVSLQAMCKHMPNMLNA